MHPNASSEPSSNSTADAEPDRGAEPDPAPSGGPHPTPPIALSIAGADSGGGAGMHADLRTMSALGVHGATAVTVLTAQNTTGIRTIHPVPADFVAEQIEAVLDDMAVAAVKTGMLASPEVIETVARFAEAQRLPQLVVDPVLVSSTGQPIFAPEAVDAYRDRLFPHALVITPNVAEAELLSGLTITNSADQRAAAEALAETGAEWIVVKGGGRAGMLDAVDIVFDAASGHSHELTGDWVDSVNVHGSGCTLAAAVTAHLANGDDPANAISEAKTFVDQAIAAAAGWTLGAGHGPLNHFDW